MINMPWGCLMRIAVDAMGGDHAPHEIVKGAVIATNCKADLEVILVGNKDEIEAELKGMQYNKDKIEIFHTDEVIEMDEHAATSFRKKKNASIAVANMLVVEKKADAVVGAGNTGAAMTSSLLKMGRIQGIERPAIAVLLPSLRGKTILIDAGANTDCSFKQMGQFAIMGSIYSQVMFKNENPKVALLNIGEEDSKGNAEVQKSFEHISQLDLNFIGNIEGRDIPYGKADVIVCDGFVGNIVLKLMEGMAKATTELLKKVFLKNIFTKISSLFLLSGLKGIKNQLDYKKVGGAVLLGVNGVSIISHGSSDAQAIENAIYRAMEFVQSDLTGKIKSGILASISSELPRKE